MILQVENAGNIEIWWDEQTHTLVKTEKNSPDLGIQNTKQKLCKIVEVTVPLDRNLDKTYKDKESKYIKLISSMQ